MRRMDFIQVCWIALVGVGSICAAGCRTVPTSHEPQGYSSTYQRYANEYALLRHVKASPAELAESDTLDGEDAKSGKSEVATEVDFDTKPQSH